jgi:hypothetical protein
MPATDAGLVFLPRFTTLVGETEFTTAPLDVSGQAGTQFQVWRGPIRNTGGTPAFSLYIEESLDAASWALGPSTPQGFPIAENATVFFAYSFRLRWFRLRVAVSGTNPMVSCWAEGILRAGDGGLWGMPGVSSLSAAGALADGPPGAAAAAPGRPAVDPMELYRWNQQFKRQVLEDDAHYFKRISNLPQPPWVPNSGIPVTPPQLQFNKGP